MPSDRRGRDIDREVARTTASGSPPPPAWSQVPISPMKVPPRSLVEIKIKIC